MNLPNKNWVEWAVFGVGLLIVVGCLAALMTDALTRTAAPPQLTVTLGTPEQRGVARYVPVTVTNQGDEPVIAVQVEVRAGQGDPATIVIEALPRQSSRDAEAVLALEETGPVSGRVVGYTLP